MPQSRPLPKWWERWKRKWEWLRHVDAAISWGQRIWDFRGPIGTGLRWAGTALTLLFAFLEEWWQAIVVGLLVVASIAGQVYLRRTRPSPTGGIRLPEDSVVSLLMGTNVTVSTSSGADQEADESESAKPQTQTTNPRTNEERRLIRELITTKLAEIESFLYRERYTAITSLTHAMQGPQPFERKWVRDTYYELRDLDVDLAEYFGSPDWDSATTDNRIERLKEILDFEL